jgi:hypothetical protein
MKYFFALFFVLIAGCSSPTTPAPYSPGGEYYVLPGTFVGTWDYQKVDSNSVVRNANACIARITEADSIFVGTIMNDSTTEVLSIRGSHFIDGIIDDPSGPPQHLYNSTTIDANGDTAFVVFEISNDGNTLTYNRPDLPSNLSINCVRK